MGSKIGTTKTYTSGSRTVFVASGTGCPRINTTKTLVRLRDDFSNGFKISKKLTKALLD